jgi:hypothetical protein
VVVSSTEEEGRLAGGEVELESRATPAHGGRPRPPLPLTPQGRGVGVRVPGSKSKVLRSRIFFYIQYSSVVVQQVGGGKASLSGLAWRQWGGRARGGGAQQLCGAGQHACRARGLTTRPRARDLQARLLHSHKVLPDETPHTYFPQRIGNKVKLVRAHGEGGHGPGLWSQLAAFAAGATEHQRCWTQSACQACLTRPTPPSSPSRPAQYHDAHQTPGPVPDVSLGGGGGGGAARARWHGGSRSFESPLSWPNCPP